MFKARLDKFLMHQDVKYDFTADLPGIGDRSVHEMSGLLFFNTLVSIDADIEVLYTCVRS